MEANTQSLDYPSYIQSSIKSQCMCTKVYVDCTPKLSVECCFTSTETVGLLGMGAQDIHLNFHTAPELSTQTV